MGRERIRDSTMTFPSPIAGNYLRIIKCISNLSTGAVSRALCWCSGSIQWKRKSQTLFARLCDYGRWITCITGYVGYEFNMKIYASFCLHPGIVNTLTRRDAYVCVCVPRCGMMYEPSSQWLCKVQEPSRRKPEQQKKPSKSCHSTHTHTQTAYELSLSLSMSQRITLRFVVNSSANKNYLYIDRWRQQYVCRTHYGLYRFGDHVVWVSCLIVFPRVCRLSQPFPIG